MGELATLTKRSHWILSNCPSTGDEVVGSNWSIYFCLANQHATWWHCPSCQGWHVHFWRTYTNGRRPSPEKLTA